MSAIRPGCVGSQPTSSFVIAFCDAPPILHDAREERPEVRDGIGDRRDGNLQVAADGLGDRPRRDALVADGVQRAASWCLFEREAVERRGVAYVRCRPQVRAISDVAGHAFRARDRDERRDEAVNVADPRA